ncbi:MAG: hypothetical protein M0D55_04850 [Elusimicrobiota bacterium]|nr:MAG: hypothetical protein M0D55_04850 [Elusimicrobiota bacterium]
MSWAAPTKNANNTNLVDLASYVVERSVPPGAFTPVATVSSATPSFVDLSPAPGVQNRYQVRSVDAGATPRRPPAPWRRTRHPAVRSPVRSGTSAPSRGPPAASTACA